MRPLPFPHPGRPATARTITARTVTARTITARTITARTIITGMRRAMGRWRVGRGRGRCCFSMLLVVSPGT